MISCEMWPTVSYCCMSSFHRKGMNWRHSLIMKIVCIFLNWESSLRLHRVVLLHITWKGKKTHFFLLITTFNQTQQYTSLAVVSRRTRCRWKESKQSCFSKGPCCSFQQVKQSHIFWGWRVGMGEWGISFFQHLPWYSFCCFFFFSCSCSPLPTVH